MKGQKKDLYQLPSKTHGIPKPEKPEKRKCLGFNPVRGDCNRLFRPRHKGIFMCDLCNEYINRHNINE